MGRPQAFFTTDPDYAMPFAPFGVAGGATYSPWTGGTGFAFMFLIWFLTDRITYTVTFTVDVSGTPTELSYEVVLTRTFVPSSGEREYYLLAPGLDDEFTSPPDGVAITGAFRWEGSFQIGDVWGEPPDPIWQGLKIEVEVDMCGVTDMTKGAAIGDYPNPQERFGAGGAPTFRLAVTIQYDKGAEGIFYIQSYDPQEYLGFTIDGGGGINAPQFSNSDFDGQEFEIVELGSPSSIFLAPAVCELNTTLWFGYEKRGGGDPIYDTSTGAELLDPQTEATDP